MTPAEKKLAALEARLCAVAKERSRAIAEAQAYIARINKNFDDVALALNRTMQPLRDQIAAEKPPPVSRIQRVLAEKHDPDWCQEDIDHFYELKRRGNKKSLQATR